MCRPDYASGVTSQPHYLTFGDRSPLQFTNYIAKMPSRMVTWPMTSRDYTVCRHSGNIMQFGIASDRPS